jgi:membrane associated rhomboid family serine protease
VVNVVLPLADENERGGVTPVLTWLFIAINFAVFILLQLPNEAFTYGWSTIPKEITTGVDLVTPIQTTIDGQAVTIPEAPGPVPIYLTLISSMFMHAGWSHILGNMLFLWIFGDNIERRLGRAVFFVFYFLAGFVASAAQIAVDPNSVIPNLGASGAIAGVLGAYIVLFPTNRVTVALGFFIFTVPAVVMIGLWALLQFVNGFGAIAVSPETSGGGVAYFAHIGGFTAGVIAGLVARSMGMQDRARRYA